jgi:hypothetical protein
MEVVLFRKAYRDGLLIERFPEDVYRWGVMASFSPRKPAAADEYLR